MKKLLLTGLLIIILVLTPNVVGVGLSPPQLRVTEAPMGKNTYVATLSTVNTGNEPAYMVLIINCLARTREHKLRVICNGCNREIGIQRGDLLHPKQIKSIINETIITEENIKANISSFPNATIGDYVLIKDSFVQRIIPIEKKDNSFCPFCNSDDLLFYDFPPDDILEHGINLACEDYPLEEIDNRTYKTIDKIEPGMSANIDIYLDIPDTKDYYNKYWEARVMAISVTDMDRLSEFIVYGIDCKFLIDTQKWIETTTTTEESNSPIVMVLSAIGIAVVATGIILFKTRERTVSIVFPKKEEKIFKKITKGKKLL